MVSKAWNLRGTIKVSTMDKNHFVFSFDSATDLHYAYSKRPWTLKGAHLILREWQPHLSWDEIDFTTSTFWVQVHGLPSAWLLEDNIKQIGAKVGKVVKVDFVEGDRVHWRRFIRLRVEVDISKPLIPGVFLPRPGLNDLWISLKYEKLPEVCFCCGILGHDSRFCGSSQKKLTNQYGRKFVAFGPWLRSENTLTPPDIYDKPGDSDFSSTDDEPERAQGASVQATPPPSQRDDAEKSQPKMYQQGKNKNSTCQDEMEKHESVVHLGKLMAEALRAECSARRHITVEETNPNLVAHQFEASTTTSNPTGTHIDYSPKSISFLPSSDTSSCNPSSQAQPQASLSLIDDIISSPA